MEEDVRTVQRYYDEAVEMEYARVDGRPEFMLTCRFLDRYIKPGDSVLDIGGGPGRYSHYLAARGCDVTLYDLSEANAAFALAKAGELGLKIEAIAGDAREVDSRLGRKFDHVLLMGPLYHLLEESDRVRAVEAALNCLKDGGTLFASFIATFAEMLYEMKHLPEYIITEEEAGRRIHDCVADVKSYAGMAFTQAYFIQQREILPFMSRFPLEKLHLFGQEGVMSPCEANILAQPSEVVKAWADLSEKLSDNDELLSWAEHPMYVGRKLDAEVADEIMDFCASRCFFDGFARLPELTDGEISLRCDAMKPANPAKRHVPSYGFEIMLGETRVGHISLRVGYVPGLYYGGNIGYGVDEEYRGRGYAGKACRLLEPVMRAHFMTHAIITNGCDNAASRRVCEKLGAKLLRVAKLPEWTDLYRDGQRYVNVFDWVLPGERA